MKGDNKVSDLKSHRLFVGNLFEAVTDNDIRSRFSSFGKVGDVQVIQRSDYGGRLQKTFAYVDIDSSTTEIEKCISLYNKSRWHGKAIDVQKAKEHYLARLKREWQRTEEVVVEEKKPKSYQEKEAKLEKMKANIPGVRISDEADWVVGKYRRPLPIVRIRGRDQHVQRIDPSKHCHQLKKIKSDEEEVVHHFELSWSIACHLDRFESAAKRSRSDIVEEVVDNRSCDKERNLKGHSGAMEQLPGMGKDLPKRMDVDVCEKGRDTLGKGIVAQLENSKSCSCPTKGCGEGCSLFHAKTVNPRIHNLKKLSLLLSDEENKAESSVTKERKLDPNLTPSGDSYSKQTTSETKRLNSLAVRKNVISEQANLVKLALDNLDHRKKLSNHIEFHSSDEEDQEKITEEGNSISAKVPHERSLSWLGLSDSDDDENTRFEIKPHFEGPGGKELFMLNQQKGLDQRFKMDERFLENQPNLSTESNLLASSNMDDIDANVEKLKTLSVLDSLLQTGCKGKTASDDLIQDLVHYDPLDAMHSKYEIDNQVTGDERSPETEAHLEVEDEKKRCPENLAHSYFHVNSPLKDLFKSQGSTAFTFLDPPSNIDEDQMPTVNEELSPRFTPMVKARFSSDFDEMEESVSRAQLDTEQSKDSTVEGFFFSINDRRLEHDCTGSPLDFARKQSVEELADILDTNRDKFRQDYKKKAKDAIRHRKKLGLGILKQRNNMSL